MTFAEKMIISFDGLLSIQRYFDMEARQMVCPFRPGHHSCGEWCPHFGVPTKTYYRTSDGKNIECTVIELSCGKEGGIISPKFVREKLEAPTDHLAELRGIMEPPKGRFKERLHNHEAGDKP